MRYRIIKEANLCGDVFYEVHFYKVVTTFGVFKRWKWVPVYEHERRGEFWLTRPARYATLREANAIVDKHTIKRIIANEGEIEVDEAYKC